MCSTHCVHAAHLPRKRAKPLLLPPTSGTLSFANRTCSKCFAGLVVNTLLHFPLPDSGDSNTLLFPSGLIQYLTLTEAGYLFFCYRHRQVKTIANVHVCLSWESILGFVVEVLLLLLDNSIVIEKKH